MGARIDSCPVCLAIGCLPMPERNLTWRGVANTKLLLRLICSGSSGCVVLGHGVCKARLFCRRLQFQLLHKEPTTDNSAQLFQLPPVRSHARANTYLTYNLSQDPLEQLFGEIRQKGGFNNNPNVEQFRCVTTNIFYFKQILSVPKCFKTVAFLLAIVAIRTSNLGCTTLSSQVQAHLPASLQDQIAHQMI